MKLLDTNVFVYGRGGRSPFLEPCRRIIRHAGLDPDAYGVDVEALQELLDVYSRRKQRGFAVQIVQETLTLFASPFPVTRLEVEEAADIVKGHPRLSPSDAIHAAVVLVNGLEGIVSADQGFDRVAGVTRFDPRDLAAG